MSALEQIARTRYVNVTTFRGNGLPVPTPARDRRW